MKFRTAYDHNDGREFVSMAGDGTQAVFKRQFTPDRKHKRAIEVSRTNLYEYIQKSSEGVDVKSLVMRYLSGDTGALGASAPNYADLTDAPTDLLDAQLRIVRARELFDQLSLDDKKVFGNNFNSFLEAASSGELDKFFSGVRDAAATNSTSSDKPLTDAQITYIKEALKSDA